MIYSTEGLQQQIEAAYKKKLSSSVISEVRTAG